MKFSVLALDYDGTLAEHGRLDPDVRSAIGEARARGIAVIVVTGRILEDLREVSGDLSWADAYVCENGAVIALPGGDPRMLCPAVSPQLQRAIESAGVTCTAGRCIIEADAADAPRILSIVRALELPLALHFNRNRLMVLPHGVCKSSGLREVLRFFRLSGHNALAIGDAENDHDLLQACEVGAAVAWGSPALLRAADLHVPGERPGAVAPYLREALDRIALPETRSVRRTVTLGRDSLGRQVQLAVRGRNLLFAGDPRSGKSWALGLVAEQLIVLGYSLCLVDPEGDYAPLETLPGVVVFGGAYALPGPQEVTRALRHPDLSIVVDLSRLDHARKDAYLRTLLPALMRLHRNSGLPHRLVIDEAHYFLDRPDAREFIDFALGGHALVTYRVSGLHPDVLATLDAVVMTHTSDPREIATLAQVAGVPDDDAFGALLGDLAIDEAALVRASAPGEAQVERFRLARRLTTHVRHRAKYRDVPLPSNRAFVFTSRSGAFGPPARTLSSFVGGLGRVPREVLDRHALRNDFSRWIAEVFGDQPLAADLHDLEERHRRGEVVDLRTALEEAISLRYEVASAAGTPGT